MRSKKGGIFVQPPHPYSYPATIEHGRIMTGTHVLLELSLLFKA